MSTEIWIAIIGVVGISISAYFSLRGLKATLKNNLDMAILQLKEGQRSIQDQAVETHKLVNSRMTELLELTRKAAEAKGKEEGKAEGNGTTTTAAIDSIKDEQKEVMLKQNEVMAEQKVIIEEQKEVLPLAGGNKSDQNIANEK